jgi:hypothetical protein
LGKQRGFFATTSRPETQAFGQLGRSPRISARAFNSLKEIEEKIAPVGRHVRAGEASRGMVTDRIKAALANAGLNARMQP